MDYFALFGLAPAYDLDAEQLRHRLRELQREYHPDRVAHLDDSARHQAVRQSALINDAYETLSHPVKRAHYLLRTRGVALPPEFSTFSDGAFLMEQMALREDLADARANADSDTLLALRQQQLMVALDNRGHAAQDSIRLGELDEKAWREGKLPDALVKARAHPQWSTLNPGARVNQAERQEQLEALVLQI